MSTPPPCPPCSEEAPVAEPELPNGPMKDAEDLIDFPAIQENVDQPIQAFIPDDAA